MDTYIREIEDANGDILDIYYFCSRGCWVDSFDIQRIGDRATEGGAYPCATDDSPHDEYCSECGVLMHSEDGRETPLVVNLIDRPPINPATRAAFPRLDGIEAS